MSDLVGNPEDRFSRVEAQLFLVDVLGYKVCYRKKCPFSSSSVYKTVSPAVNRHGHSNCTIFLFRSSP